MVGGGGRRKEEGGKGNKDSHFGGIFLTRLNGPPSGGLLGP